MNTHHKRPGMHSVHCNKGLHSRCAVTICQCKCHDIDPWRLFALWLAMVGVSGIIVGFVIITWAAGWAW
jgi:hypothetical protein